MTVINNTIPKSILQDNKYIRYFHEVQYNGKTLSDSEREEFISVIDETIARYSEGLPMMHEYLANLEDCQGELSDTIRTIVSVMLFVTMTMIDCMVLGKYFILADIDYERRLMRGKLRVILNEGFKKLYGFEQKTHEKSEWNRLLPLMKFFPENINHEYQDLTYCLEQHARSSSWWKPERDLETHLGAEEWYDSRQEEIIESKVMMDSMKLFSALLAVDHFLTKAHGYLRDTLFRMYQKGELIIV